MSQSLGYFCSFKPNDGSLLDKIEQKYGSRLEGLSSVQKAYLLNQLAQNLLNVEVSKVGTMIADDDINEVRQLASDVYKNLEIKNHLPLIKAIAEVLDS